MKKPYTFERRLEAFWAKVDRTSQECWLWQGALNAEGYGRFSIGPRMVGAHRWIYEVAYGPIPQGLELDHLCRNPACVRPGHLEPVSHAENLRRGVHSRLEGLCAKRLHRLEGENLMIRLSGKRRCRACHNLRHKLYQRSRRAKLSVTQDP